MVRTLKTFLFFLPVAAIMYFVPFGFQKIITWYIVLVTETPDIYPRISSYYAVTMLLFGFSYFISSVAIRELYSNFLTGLDRLAPYIWETITLYILVYSIPVAFADIYRELNSKFACIKSASELDFIYFSFTTFTTLGYGDMLPVAQCKAVAMGEAMLGLTAMPVLVAGVLHLFSGWR